MKTPYTLTNTIAVSAMVGLSLGALSLLSVAPRLALPLAGKAAIVSVAVLLLAFQYPWWKLLQSWRDLGGPSDWVHLTRQRPQRGEEHYSFWFWFRCVKGVFVAVVAVFIGFVALAASGALGGTWN